MELSINLEKNSENTSFTAFLEDVITGNHSILFFLLLLTFQNKILPHNKNEIIIIIF